MFVDPFIFGILGNINRDSSRSVMLIEKHPALIRAMFMNASMSPHPDTLDGTLFCIRKLTMECKCQIRSATQSGANCEVYSPTSIKTTSGHGR